jgi:hypothetical protein
MSNIIQSLLYLEHGQTCGLEASKLLFDKSLNQTLDVHHRVEFNCSNKNTWDSGKLVRTACHPIVSVFFPISLVTLPGIVGLSCAKTLIRLSTRSINIQHAQLYIAGTI